MLQSDVGSDRADDRSDPRHPWVWAMAVLWLLVAAGGLWVVVAYENAPGEGAAAPSRWPTDSRLARSTDTPTLVMLAHPQCSCSRASVSELAEALARAGSPAKTYVLFLKPTGFSDGWEQSELWKSAAAIPGVTAVRDDDGLEAGRFGASTSGQTLLYDANGALLFSGGITGARGHAGDNDGRSSLVALLSKAGNATTGTRVFGCPLFARGLK